MKKYILSLFLNIFLFADDGRIYFFGNCISCHAEIAKKVAPQISEIKGYYLIKYPKKNEFVKNMADWAYNPNPLTAQMPQAIKKYQLMPHLAIDLETLQKISEYIYENSEFGNR